MKVTSLRTLAVLDERQDHWQRAETRLRQAILALLPVNASTPLADRLRWQMELSRNYRELVNILLHENRIRDAFAVWQNYLRAGALALNGRLDALPPAGAFRGDVLTFARLAARYGSWHQNGNNIEFAWLDGSSEGIDRLARRYAALCSRPNSSNDQIRATGRELHRSFGPLFDQALAHGSLIVQPDGELGRIPWTSLPVSPTAVVADRAAVSICPLPLLAEIPSSNIDLSHTLAVAADAIAPARIAEFRPLPGIDSELSAVTGAASRCVVLRGTAATAANIEQNLSSATTLHFAGHAVTSSQMVSLLVAPGADSVGGTDDTWRPQAASCRKLALAVFGACSTARYDEMETVAPQNLPQLFLLAGTQHVVASLWDVDSLLVSEFMKKLYSQIRSGIAIEAAMRRSMASIRAKKEWESPYYWASFALFTR